MIYLKTLAILVLWLKLIKRVYQSKELLGQLQLERGSSLISVHQDGKALVEHSIGYL